MKIRSLFKKWQKNEDGATALVYAISAPALIGLLSIAFEIGHFQQRNARIQSAADMAAMATALEYQLTKNRGKAILEGKGNAYENGYVGAEGSIRVESPIVSGPYAGEEGAIVHITQEQERYFSKIFGSRTKVTHKVESTVLQMGGQPICMLALHPTNAGAITVTGSASLEMEDCAMHTNSNAMSAYNLSGSASVTADCISATGTIKGGAGATLSNCDRPKNYEPVISDPYADIEVPNNVASMPCLTPSFQSGGSIKMGAGRYCNKDFGLRGVLELTEKGVYIFDGVSVFFKSKGSMVGPPEGVTLIFMNGARLENTNGGAMELYAQPDGPYAGVLMYADRETSDRNVTVRINGNQSARFEGALYFPTQKIDFRGGADLRSNCTNIVASEIEFSGNSALTNRDCDPVGTRSITQDNKGIRLVN